MFYEEIIRKLNDAGVRYAIVGGMAVNLHGHIRMTADLDIILEQEDLIKMKEVTGRDHDKADIRRLKILIDIES